MQIMRWFSVWKLRETCHFMTMWWLFRCCVPQIPTIETSFCAFMSLCHFVTDIVGTLMAAFLSTSSDALTVARRTPPGEGQTHEPRFNRGAQTTNDSPEYSTVFDVARDDVIDLVNRRDLAASASRSVRRTLNLALKTRDEQGMGEWLGGRCWRRRARCKNDIQRRRLSRPPARQANIRALCTGSYWLVSRPM